METGDSIIAWDEVIKKEARGINDCDLGEVQEVTSENVVTQKGIVNTKWFQIPKRLALEFDGNKLILKVGEEEAKMMYAKDESPLEEHQKDTEKTVQLVEERLDPKKREIIEEATLVKEPVKETKQMDVELTHQELALERKTLSEPRKTDEKPVDSRTEIKIPLKKEEVESTKQSYVREEVVATKKQIKETRNVSEELTSEKITED